MTTDLSSTPLPGDALAASGYHTADFEKPDGRSLTLYGLGPIRVDSEIPSPSPDPVGARPLMRWHPVRGEWVMYAAHRMGRTFLPPPEYNPLAPTRDPEHPTELPRGEYDIAVFDNRFPSLSPVAGAAPRAQDAARRAVPRQARRFGRSGDRAPGRPRGASAGSRHQIGRAHV